MGHITTDGVSVAVVYFYTNKQPNNPSHCYPSKIFAWIHTPSRHGICIKLHTPVGREVVCVMHRMLQRESNPFRALCVQQTTTSSSNVR